MRTCDCFTGSYCVFTSSINSLEAFLISPVQHSRTYVGSITMNISLPPPVQNPYANSNADHTEPTPTQRTTLHLGRHRSPHQPESRTRLGRSLLERAMRHYYCFLKMCGLGRKQYHGKHRHRRDACRCVKVKDRLLSRVGAAACTIGGGRVSKRSRHAIICGHEL